MQEDKEQNDQILFLGCDLKIVIVFLIFISWILDFNLSWASVSISS